MLVLAALATAVATWGSRARWLPYAISGAQNAGKTATELERDLLGSLTPLTNPGDRDLRFDVGSPGASLSVRVLEAAASPRGTIFVLHGIRDSKRSMLGIGAAFRERGFRVVLVDLRGQGMSTGDWLSFGDLEGRYLQQLADALGKRGLLAPPIGVYGPSYGGNAALQMARRDRRVHAVVTVATFTRMRDVVPLYTARVVPTWIVSASDVSDAMDRAGTLGGFRPENADAVVSIAATDAQVLILHGRADGNIPWQHGEELHHAAPQHSQLVIVEGRDHGTIMSDASVVRESVAWFERWLGPDAN